MTSIEPTKSGITGLLAAAQGRRRQDPIEDLLALRLGVRTDQAGSLLRDYHTVSDLRGRPLLSAQVYATGGQKPTSTKKMTHETWRYYLQDAVFVVAVSGSEAAIAALTHAISHPAFPLALGRRPCAPTQPLIIRPDHAQAGGGALWPGWPLDVLRQVPWQASHSGRASVRQDARREGRGVPHDVSLPVTVDDEDGNDLRDDMPISFDPTARGFTIRRVRQEWVRIPTGFPSTTDENPASHDPFALLGEG